MSLIRTFGVVFFLNLVDYMLSPIAAILVVKTLSVADYGFYSLATTVLGFILSFCTLGLGQYNYKHIPGRHPDEQYRVLGRSLFIELAFSLAGIAVVVAVMRDDLGKYSLVALFAAKALISVFNNELLRFVGYQKKNILKSVIAFIDSRFWLLPLLAFYLLKRVSVSAIFISQLLGSVGMFAVFAIVLDRRKLGASIRFERSFAGAALRYSIPLILIDLGMYFLEMGSRYILKAFSTYEAIGLFSFAYSWFAIIFKFGMLFIYILQPYFSESYHRHQSGEAGALENYRGYLRIGFKFSLVLLSAAVLFFVLNYRDAVLLVGKPQYLETKRAVFLLAPFPLFMFLSYFYQVIMVLGGKTARLPLYYLAMAAVSIGLNFALIPFFGYEGAALASTLSYAALFAILFAFSRDEYSRIGLPKGEALRVAAFILAFLGANLLGPVLVSSLIARMAAYAAIFVGAFFALGVFSKEDMRLIRHL